MEKIGIITIHNCKSFGACLQTYALYKYLETIGYDCEVIDLRRREHGDYVKSKKYKFYYRDETYMVTLKRFIKELILPTKKVIDSSKQNFESFFNLIKLSPKYRSIDDLYINPPIYDIYVTGSDQVWNPYQPYCLEPYFLTFVPEGKKKISFAASIGVEQVEEKVLKDFKKWLVDYEHISVRENEAKKLLQPFVSEKIEVVSDPTFLLDISHWNSLCKVTNIGKPYILLFALSFQYEFLDYVLKYHATTNKVLVIIGANQPCIKQQNIVQLTDAGPFEFLSLIRDAELVFTDSYHGTVFSLILGVSNFYTYIDKCNKRGSRILNLLSRFKLENHLLDINFAKDFTKLDCISINRQKVLGVISEIQYHDRDILHQMLK